LVVGERNLTILADAAAKTAPDDEASWTEQAFEGLSTLNGLVDDSTVHVSCSGSFCEGYGLDGKNL
jgi:hypothetical protein